MAIDEFLDLVRRRRTVRRYLDDPVSDEQIDNIIEAGRWAPSGVNTQPWEFLIVRDRATIGDLASLWIADQALTEERDPTFSPSDKQYLKRVPVMIVVLADTRCRRVYPRLNEETPDVIFHHSMAAAIQNMHLAAAAQGLGSVWLSVHPYMQGPLRKLLNVPPILDVEVVIPVGHPTREFEGRRRDTARMVHRELYDPSKLRDLAAFEEYLPANRAGRALE
ncbi:MAG: nitroreductase family protein [Chloroflexi bacterium]|nr:nitroreductase family protein [Chloroflexota bacterium]